MKQLRVGRIREGDDVVEEEKTREGEDKRGRRQEMEKTREGEDK